MSAIKTRRNKMQKGNFKETLEILEERVLTKAEFEEDVQSKRYALEDEFIFYYQKYFNQHFRKTGEMLTYKELVMLPKKVIAMVACKDANKQRPVERILKGTLKNSSFIKDDQTCITANGVLTYEKQPGYKSFDWKHESRKMFIFAKNINNYGGAQDAEYNEIVHTLKAIGNSKTIEEVIFFLSGDYFSSTKMYNLNGMAPDNTKIFTDIDEFADYIETL